MRIGKIMWPSKFSFKGENFKTKKLTSTKKDIL
jgi:hypothetical protein